jgi:hypothetical protein
MVLSTFQRLEEYLKKEYRITGPPSSDIEVTSRKSSPSVSLLELELELKLLLVRLRRLEQLRMLWLDISSRPFSSSVSF